jgi:uncharacterized membrane protein YagU involved in acid resistance
MGKIIRGAIAGLAATVVMTGVMYAGKWLGLLQAPPPKEITARAEETAGADLGGSTFSLSWLAAHLGFGMAAGAAFPWAGRAYPGSPPLAGALYGLSIWFQAYVGVLPELGLYPDPVEDSSSRQAVLVAAHLVYGALLGRLYGPPNAS